MVHLSRASLLTAIALPITTLAKYTLTKDYSGYDFVSSFDFYNGPDPTNGHVQYKGYATANATGLTGFLVGPNGTNTENTTLPSPVYLGVDHTNIYPTKIGRPSVRVSSVETYNHSLIIADIIHMPSSTCGLWPAFWLLGTSAPWPNAGEIDIIENVNDNDFNMMSLHTNAGVTLSNDTTFFNGTIKTVNCDVAAKDQPKNAGCTIQDKHTTASYGSNFNSHGGSVFATQYTPDHIAIWFFPRTAIPNDIKTSNPIPPSIHNSSSSSSWGTPNALFRPTNTNTATTNTTLTQHFTSLQLTFSTTFCGDWAGGAWSSSPCSKLAATCEEYVSGHPEAFEDAFWAVQSVKVYEEEEKMTIKKADSKYGHVHAVRKVPGRNLWHRSAL